MKLPIGTEVRWKTRWSPFGRQYPTGTIVGVTQNLFGSMRYVIEYQARTEYGRVYKRTKMLKDSQIINPR